MTEATKQALTCYDIQFCLFLANNRSQSVIAFNTTRALLHEADVLVVRNSGVTVEYEVKTSRSDFRADFRKEQKHRQMAAGHKGGPQYFFYACEPGIIEAADVPAYAGLVHLVQHGRRHETEVRVVKPAPRLHKEKSPEIHERICRSLMHKALYHNEAECDAHRLERISALERELGELYATIFGDGGHRQTELDASRPLLEEDDLFGELVYGPPTRLTAGIASIHQRTQRAEAAEALLTAGA
jgi:hypothetical protein